MLDIIGRRIDHSGQQELVVGKRKILPNGPFVGMARVCGLDGDGLRVYAKNDLDDLGERDVVGVRAFVVAPADMDANHAGRNVAERMVERFGVEGGAPQKLRFGKVLKRRMPRHCQIGAIDLQHKTRSGNGGVFFPHRLGDGRDVIFVAAIISVRQKARDHARRGRGQKRLGRPRGFDGGAHIGEVLRQRLPIADGDRTDAGHALEAPCSRELRHLAAEIGKRRQVGVRF